MEDDTQTRPKKSVEDLLDDLFDSDDEIDIIDAEDYEEEVRQIEAEARKIHEESTKYSVALYSSFGIVLLGFVLYFTWKLPKLKRH